MLGWITGLLATALPVTLVTFVLGRPPLFVVFDPDALPDGPFVIVLLYDVIFFNEAPGVLTVQLG